MHSDFPRVICNTRTSEMPLVGDDAVPEEGVGAGADVTERALAGHIIGNR